MPSNGTQKDYTAVPAVRDKIQIFRVSLHTQTVGFAIMVSVVCICFLHLHVYLFCLSTVYVSCVATLFSINFFGGYCVCAGACPGGILGSLSNPLPAENGSPTPAILSRNCIRNNLRRPKIPNFPGGACPQTPLAARFARYMETYATSSWIRHWSLDFLMNQPGNTEYLSWATPSPKFWACPCLWMNTS